MRREDQDKINKFSRLHQREQALEEDLKIKAVNIEVPLVRIIAVLMHLQKDKEDLEELSNELVLADEDEKIPYAVQHLLRTTRH